MTINTKIAPKKFNRVLAGRRVRKADRLTDDNNVVVNPLTAVRKYQNRDIDTRCYHTIIIVCSFRGRSYTVVEYIDTRAEIVCNTAVLQTPPHSLRNTRGDRLTAIFSVGRQSFRRGRRRPLILFLSGHPSRRPRILQSGFR